MVCRLVCRFATRGRLPRAQLLKQRLGVKSTPRPMAIETKNRKLGKLGKGLRPSPRPMTAVAPTKKVAIPRNISLMNHGFSVDDHTPMPSSMMAAPLIAMLVASAMFGFMNSESHRMTLEYIAARPRTKQTKRTGIGRRFMVSSQRTISVIPTAELQKDLLIATKNYSIIFIICLYKKEA